jgi:hypothetical protein
VKKSEIIYLAESLAAEMDIVVAGDTNNYDASYKAGQFLEVFLKLGMLPPPDHIEPISMDKNGIVLEIVYNHAPAKDSSGGIYKGWKDE